MSKQVPRKSQLPGMTMQGVDPTGDAFVEKASLGLQNEGYGLAAFRKATASSQLLNFEKSQTSYF